MTQRKIDSNTEKKIVDGKDSISDLWGENNQEMALGTRRPLKKNKFDLCLRSYLKYIQDISKI